MDGRDDLNGFFVEEVADHEDMIAVAERQGECVSRWLNLVIFH